MVFIATWAFSLVAASRGYSPVAVRELLVEHKLIVVVYRLGMWDLPRPGISPCLLHGEAASFPLRHQGSPSMVF